MVSSIQLSAVLELLVVLFQVFGVLALCLSRFHAGPRWADRGRVGFLIALLGLGVAGALCGRNDSEFSLFAGLSLATLLVGMCLGGHSDPSEANGVRVEPELPPLR